MADKAPETHGTPPGGRESRTEDRNVTVASLIFADDADTEGGATLTELQGQRCPNCTTGVLYVTRYDPEALHERGENAKLLTDEPTGGAYEVNCFSCHFHESRVLPRETEEQRNEREDEQNEQERSRGGWGR